MEISAEKRESYNILRVDGRLDSNTSGEFEKQLLPMLEKGKENIVDFKGLNYISSSGLRVLLVAAKELDNNSQKLTIVSMQDHIKEVFDISGFTELFNIKPENSYE